jgi:hypothetical protein
MNLYNIFEGMSQVHNIVGEKLKPLNHPIKNEDTKPKTTTQPIEDDITNSNVTFPPIKSSNALPSKSTKVKLRTPATQWRESMGIGGSFYDSLPLKTSTAQGDTPNQRKENAIKFKCLQRLSSRFDGLVSPALQRKLLTVNLSNLGMPNPEAEKWGGIGLTMSVG